MTYLCFPWLIFISASYFASHFCFLRVIFCFPPRFPPLIFCFPRVKFYFHDWFFVFRDLFSISVSYPVVCFHHIYIIGGFVIIISISLEDTVTSAKSSIINSPLTTERNIRRPCSGRSRGRLRPVLPAYLKQHPEQYPSIMPNQYSAPYRHQAFTTGTTIDSGNTKQHSSNIANNIRPCKKIWYNLY